MSEPVAEVKESAPKPAKAVKDSKETKKDKREKKVKYIERLHNCLSTYSKVLLVDVTNVSSNQLYSVRKLVEANGALVMGKNTLIRKALRTYIDNGNPQYATLLTFIKGNIGLAFTKGDMSELSNAIKKFRVPAAARVGQIAPLDVHIPQGPTGLEPTMTSFLHALNIQSKIVKGQIELIADVHLIKKNDKVQPGQVALLQKLNITPFSFGSEIRHVYDNGFVFEAHLLSLTDADVLSKFSNGVLRVAAISLAIGYPTLASVPHSIVKAYQNLLAVSVETEYSFEGAAKLKEMLANPGAFQAAAAAAAPAAADSGKPAAAAAAPAAAEKVESEEEMELDLFG